MFSYKNNMCGYGDKLYIFSYKSFSNQVAQMFDIKTFEKKDMMALVGGSDTNAYPQCNGQYIVYSIVPEAKYYRNAICALCGWNYCKIKNMQTNWDTDLFL